MSDIQRWSAYAEAQGVSRRQPGNDRQKTVQKKETEERYGSRPASGQGQAAVEPGNPRAGGKRPRNRGSYRGRFGPVPLRDSGVRPIIGK